MHRLSAEDQLWLKTTSTRLHRLAWDQVERAGLTLKVELGPEAKSAAVFGDRTALLLLAAACLEGATKEGRIWSHAVDEASYADAGSAPLELHRVETATADNP